MKVAKRWRRRCEASLKGTANLRRKPSETIRTAFAPGAKAVRIHAKPFIAIQLVAALLVLGYYLSPEVRELAGSLQRARVEGGILFSIIGTALAGTVLPEIFKRLTRDPHPTPIGRLVVNMGFFGFFGGLIDLFYQFQAYLFGSEVTPWVILQKTIFDQLVFTPLLAMPLGVLLLTWINLGFSFSQTAGVLRTGFYRQRVVPAMVMNWSFWTPMVICIYALPLNLQMSLFLLAQAAWSLIYLHIVNASTEQVP